MNNLTIPYATDSDNKETEQTPRKPAHVRPRRTKKGQSIEYRRNGEQVKLKLQESLYAALMAAKERISDLTDGKDYSQTVVVRRALSLYLNKLAIMSDEEILRTEVHSLERGRSGT